MTNLIDRRLSLALLAGTSTALMLASRGAAAAPTISLMTAGPGSAFLPYGTGIAQVINATDVAAIKVVESKGSNENLSAVDGSPTTIGTAFLGSAFDAISGAGFAAGRRHENIRALFPMYETAFMAAALVSSKLTKLQDLDGRKVGCGPANGPAEGYVRAAAEIAGVKPVIIGGTPADQAKQLLAGEIDVFWQGASVPIPSLVSVTNAAACTLFGLSETEQSAMRKRFPFMSDFACAPGTYRGQEASLQSVAAWNVVVAHKDLSNDLASAITRTILRSPDLVRFAGAAARSTTAQNAKFNRVVPYHPGALQVLGELGVKLE